MLSISQLTHVYPNGTRAIDAVSLDIPTGMFGLLGPNGAGKTTLIRCLAGIAAPDKGGMYFDDQEFRRDRLDLRRRMHLLPDFPLLFWEQSVVRNIAITLRLYEADGDGAGALHCATGVARKPVTPLRVSD